MRKTKHFTRMAALILAAAIILSLALPLGASASSQGKMPVFIEDAAGLLSESETARLKTDMDRLADYCGAAFATCTGQMLEDRDPTEYAREVFDSYFDDDTAVLMLLCPDKYIFRLISNGVVYQAIEAIYESKISAIVDKTMEEDDAYGCASQVFSAIRQEVELWKAAEASPSKPAGQTLSYTNPDTGYSAIVEDDSGLMSESEKAALLEEMKGITAYCGAMFKSTDDNPDSVEKYAQNVFIENFYHDDPEEDYLKNATLFLVDMDNREIYIMSDKYAYTVITDAYANTITDNVYKLASDKEYYQCASKAFLQIRTLLEGGRIAQPMKYITNALMALVLAILGVFLFMLMQRRKVATDPAKLTKLVTSAAIVSMGTMTILNTRKILNSSSSGGHSSGGHSFGGGGHSGGFSGGGGGHKF